MPVTLKELAAHCGVSMQTVSQALRPDGAVRGTSRVSDRMRERVRAAAAELGYTLNMSAASLRGNSSRAVGVIQPTFPIGCYGEALTAVTTELAARGYTTYSMVSPGEQWIDSLLSQLAARQVDAVMILISNNRINPADYDLPLLIVGECGTHFHLGVDLVEGGAMATRHLLSHGHRRIGFLGAMSRLRDYKFEGYRNTMSQAGIAVSGSWSIELMQNESAMRELHHAITKEKVTAFVCANDFIAGKCASYLRRHGLRVPEDVALTGFDGMSFVEFTCPTLTTVIQPMTQLGRRAVELLMQRLEGGKLPDQAELLQPELHIGGSCGCPVVPDEYLYWEGTMSTLSEINARREKVVPTMLQEKLSYKEVRG